MTMAAIACATCGGPTVAEEVPPELEVWVGLVRPVCETCVQQADDEERAAAEALERRQQAERRARRLERVGVPPYLVGYGFEDIDLRDGLDDALAAAELWARGELRGLGLVGPVGTGKTRVGIAAANEVCRRTQAVWYSTPVLIEHLSDEFGTKRREAALDALIGTRPLVLDDLDKASASEHAARAIFEAVEARCDGGGQLLVTTNLRGSELARRWAQPYGEAIVDRLSLLRWLRVAGASKRGNGRRV